jgi:hypothetical protein
MFTVTEEKKVQTTHPGQDGFYKRCQSDRTAKKKQNTSWHGGTVWRASRRHCPAAARWYDMVAGLADRRGGVLALARDATIIRQVLRSCCALRNTPMASLTQVHCCSAELINHAPSSTELTYLDGSTFTFCAKLEPEGNLPAVVPSGERPAVLGLGSSMPMDFSVNHLTSSYSSTFLDRI